MSVSALLKPVSARTMIRRTRFLKLRARLDGKLPCKCTACGESLGTARFDQHQLEHKKYRGQQKLQCKVCTASQLARISALKEALQKSKVRCKCFQPFHSEKCPLSPAYYGQKKWPGCDGHVTQLDRNFLDGLNPRPKWWNKALGRGS